MTVDEAAEIIAKALIPIPHEALLSNGTFAKRMAIGLAALGLLDHCALSIEPPVAGNPLGRAALRQRDEYDAGLTRDDALIPPITDTGAKSPNNIAEERRSRLDQPSKHEQLLAEDAARAMQEGSTDVPPIAPHLATDSVLPNGTTASGQPAWASKRIRP
jgi:hypothetical protein